MSYETLIEQIHTNIHLPGSKSLNPILSLDSLTLNLDLPLTSLENPDYRLNFGFDSHKPSRFYESSNNPLSSSHLLDENIHSLLNPNPKELISLRINELKSMDLHEILNEPSNLNGLKNIVKDILAPQMVFEMCEELNSANCYTSSFKFDEFSNEYQEKIPNLLDPKVKNYKPITLDDDVTNDPHLISKKRKKQHDSAILQKKINSENEIYAIQEEEKANFQNIFTELRNKNEIKSLWENNEQMEGLLSMTNNFLFTYESDANIEPFQLSQLKTSQNSLWNNISSQKLKKPIVSSQSLSLKVLEFLNNLNEKSDSESSTEDLFEENTKELSIEEENKLAESENKRFRIIRLSDKQKDQTNSLSNSAFAYAIEDHSDLSDFYQRLPKEKFAMDFPFELDDFQKRAILHLEQKESVFVAAHTSAGKTVVAEYAIALAQKHKTRAIYTSPIKALSNQKYREFHQKFQNVGIITGDVVKNSDASCLIVTTEILRNMLYKGSDMVRDIEWVIFDEVHYVNNDERGVVWEETFIMLPEHIGIIMLSATVPNSMEFADWVGRTKNRKIFVQQTFKRPVPLEHNIYLLGKFHVIKEKEGGFREKEYVDLLKNIERVRGKEREDVMQKKKQQKEDKVFLGHWKDNKKKQMLLYKLKEANTKFIKKITPNDLKKTGWKETVRNLKELINNFKKNNMLPAVIFVFSKQKIKELTNSLLVSSYSLSSKDESGRVRAYFNSALKNLKPSDRELPQFLELREMLEKGFAMHHGDLLPLGKEIVEILFSDGLVKVLFATETFAMGINMPAKTVVFYGMKKHDGTELRWFISFFFFLIFANSLFFIQA